jgi:hypothetical protein
MAGGVMRRVAAATARSMNDHAVVARRVGQWTRMVTI